MRTSRIVSLGLAALSTWGCGDVADEEHPGQSAQLFTLGGTYRVVSKGASKCLDVKASGTRNGTKIQQWTCTGQDNQAFRFEDAGSGAVRLVSAASGKCVDVAASGSINGSKARLWRCNGGAAQSFSVEDRGNGIWQLRSGASGRCLEVKSASDGAAVQLWTCNGTDAQAWQLARLDSPPPDAPPSVPSGDARQACVDKINALRATIGMSALTRWTENEACADGQAQSDASSGQPHGAFSQCPNWAQNECPGWPSKESIYGPDGCLDMMWREGPGEPYSEHGHYINMTNPSYTKVACGFFATADGRIWAVQDFR